MQQLTSKTAARISLGLILIFSSLTFALAQGPGQGPRQARDPLAGLKRALSEANAPALTTAQETQLTALIQAYRDGLPDGPNADLQAAHTAYDNAILAGDAAAAQTAATTIAGLIAAQTAARLKAAATLEVQALAVLRANAGQVEALTTRFGTTGLVRILHSLAGGGFRGPGGFGGLGGFGDRGGPRGHESSSDAGQSGAPAGRRN